jgi:hypothetical protein
VPQANPALEIQSKFEQFKLQIHQDVAQAEPERLAVYRMTSLLIFMFCPII